MTRRDFGFFSIFGFSMIFLSTWKTQVGTIVFGLTNGGTAGILYKYITCFAGFSAVIASMSELASIAPTARGQYHWVSESAPRSIQRYISYVVGWLCVLGWQAGGANSAYLAAAEIQGLAILNNAGYVPKAWHLTLITIGIAFFCGIFNTSLAHRLLVVENMVLVLHVVGFLAIMIPPWGPYTALHVYRGLNRAQ